MKLTNISDPYFDTQLCIDRLYKVYQKHNNIIIACDFDETIYPFHNPSEKFEKVIELLQECSKLNLTIIIFTSGLNERHIFMREYCQNLDINIYGINKNVDSMKYGREGAKVYYNILLDDKAGLGQSYQILKETISKIKKNYEI
jgi:hypothetical protein